MLGYMRTWMLGVYEDVDVTYVTSFFSRYRYLHITSSRSSTCNVIDKNFKIFLSICSHSCHLPIPV